MKKEPLYLSFSSDICLKVMHICKSSVGNDNKLQKYYSYNYAHDIVKIEGLVYFSQRGSLRCRCILPWVTGEFLFAMQATKGEDSNVTNLTVLFINFRIPSFERTWYWDRCVLCFWDWWTSDAGWYWKVALIEKPFYWSPPPKKKKKILPLTPPSSLHVQLEEIKLHCWKEITSSFSSYDNFLISLCRFNCKTFVKE